MNPTDLTAPIAVLGATGQQGSATVHALLERGLPVRAITRNVDSAAAHALTERGATVVADLDTPESLRAAFEGAAAAFAMTVPTHPTVSTVRSHTAARSVTPPKAPGCRSWSSARSAVPSEIPVSRTSRARGASRNSSSARSRSISSGRPSSWRTCPGLSPATATG
jgi:hypothetical protein